MARINTLSNFLTDVAASIKTKKQLSTPIKPEDFDTLIDSISGGEIISEEITVTPSTSQQIIVPSEGKNAITKVTVSPVTNTIDNNIQQSNIKNNVTILGVTGSYAGNATLDVSSDENISIDVQTLVINTEPELPYIELDYIQSNGDQWINTGYTVKNNTKFVLESNINSVQGSSYTCPFGTRAGASIEGALIFARTNNSSLVIVDWGGTETQGNSLDSYYDKKTTITFTKGNFKIEDEASNDYEFTFTSGVATTVYPMYLFNLNESNTVYPASTCGCSMKLYSFKVYEGTELIRDFIPVKRKSDNVICLYDKVIKTFYINQGTGTFTAGPVKGE